LHALKWANFTFLSIGKNICLLKVVKIDYGKEKKKENPIKKKREMIFVFSRCFRASTFLVLGLSTINFAQ